MQNTPVYLATVLLEKNRWSINSPPSLLASEWIQPALAAGFDGIELWEYHYTLATAAEKEHLRQSKAVSIYNCYASLRPDELHRRLAAVQAAIDLGAQGIKFNFGKEARALAAEIEAVRQWASHLPAYGMRLLCECHEGTSAATPESAHNVAELLATPQVGFITHAFAENPERLSQWLHLLGSKLVHVHVQSRDSAGTWLMIENYAERARATLHQLSAAGFSGSFTIEFTAGVNTPGESPSSLFRTSCADLHFLCRKIQSPFQSQ